MKKIVTLLLAMLMVLALAGCTKKAEPESQPEPEPAPDTSVMTYAEHWIRSLLPQNRQQVKRHIQHRS